MFIKIIVVYLNITNNIININNMETLKKITGKTEKEIQVLYLSAIETLIHFGMQEPEARKVVRETFKQTLGL